MDVEHRIGGEQRLADERAVGADDHRIRLDGGDSSPRFVVADPLGLVQLDPEGPGGLGHRRRPGSAAPPAPGVRPRDDEPRGVRGSLETLEDGGGELRGTEVDRSHDFEAIAAREAAFGSGGAVLALGLAHRPHGLFSLRSGRAVEDEHPIEVIDLVLDDACLEPGGLDHPSPPLLV